jgi:hypoxanthine phosphoribosyltransferase
VVGAVHYDDDRGTVLESVQRTQWMSADVELSGGRVLLVDEVDDSRRTLAFIADEMLRFFDEVEEVVVVGGSPSS